MSMERPDISPAVYSLLQDFQPTKPTACLETSFFMWQKLLAKDKNFKA